MTEPEGLNDVAIVGLDARLPGAPTVERFWENLRAGVESIAFHDAEPPAVRNGMAWVRASPWLEDVELFDAAFFGFNPREAEVMDPQIRLFLESAWAALESAGCDPQQYRGRIGVFAGAAMSTYLTNNLIPNEEVMRASGGGVSSLGVFNDRDSLATIASYKLDLTGPSVTVQTFCSTSLVAVHLACQSLLSGECDLALAGASSINVGIREGYLHTEGSILSPDGHCRSFDARAAGTVFGNGVGAVVLKRLADALEQGDLVHAVIRGSAVNNDGARKAGYAAPSVVGQSRAIAEAMAVAQVSPDSIGYVEAHGTATTLGDPIEIEALTRAFRGGTDRRGYCWTGSAKSNVGHLDRAAGIAALVKTVLMLQHRQIPPSLHFERPNPKIDFEASPFKVATELIEWRSDGAPRRAGVSALGVGGTNAHVIVEEAPRRDASGPGRRSQLLVVSARTPSALEAARTRLAAHLRGHPHIPLADTAWTLLVGRHRFEERCAVVAESPEQAAAALEDADPRRLLRGASRATERPVVFLFPGQGAQYAGMTRGLYEGAPVYRETLDRCAELLRGPLGLDLRETLFATGDAEAAASERLRQTALTQPALLAVELALARLWMSWGIEPAAMLGHSVGEYAAAHLAGVLSLEDALGLVAERGRLMQSLPPGSMLAVHAAVDEVVPLLSSGLDVAAVNAPGFCVVSGPAIEIDALEASLSERERATTRLHTSHAFHSSMMDPILGPFRERVRAARLERPRLPFVSNLTGTWITADQATSPDYWVDHLRRAVRFADGVRTLWEEPERILLEVGPGEALCGLARLQAPAGGAQVAVPSVRRPHDPGDDARVLLRALGRLWVAGAAVDGARLFEGERRQRVRLPGYPFERERYWIDPPKASERRRPAAGKQQDPASWFYAPTWTLSLPPQRFQLVDAGQPTRWLLFVDGGPVGDALVKRLREAGEETIAVRPGPGFAGSRRKGFYVDPASRDDYAKLVEEVGEEGRHVGRIVHAWTAAPPRGGRLDADAVTRGHELGFYSLLFLAQALGEAGWSHPLRLSVVGRLLHRILPTDPVHPERASLMGLLRVLPQEYQNLTCSSVDLGPESAGEPAVVDALLRELRAGAPGAAVALRGGQRFVHGYAALPLPAPPQRPTRVREGAAVLITGGLGGVTSVLAAYLAHTLRARLVLTGRTPLPEREAWAEWRERHGDADPVSQRLARIEALESLGAEVLTVQADVASAEEMRRAVRVAEERFGPLSGVIHGAGLVGGASFRPIQQIGRAECEQHFRPKALGLLALDAALDGRALDFRLITSSLSSVLGGYAYGAYAASNVFADAWAELAQTGGGAPWLSVNWDEWRLVERPEDPAARAGGLGQYALSATEGMGAFGRLLELEGAARVVVSTGDLESRLDRWVRLDPRRVERLRETRESQPKRNPRPHLQTAYVAPSNPTEERIASIWADLLGVDAVGIQDSFFDLGGHSLLAIQAITAIRTELNAEISVASLFEGPTVESLSRLVRPGGETRGFAHSSDRGRRRKEELRRRQGRVESHT